MHSSSPVPEGVSPQTLTLFFRDSIQLLKQALKEDDSWFEPELSQLFRRHLVEAGVSADEAKLREKEAQIAPMIEPMLQFLKEQKESQSKPCMSSSIFAKIIHDIRSPIAALKTVLSVPSSLDPRRMDIINSVTERIDRIARELDSRATV